MRTITNGRRMFAAAAALALGVALTTLGLAVSPATAAAPPVFEAGYDSYLNGNQRGITAESANGGTCPTDDVVDGLTAWHFVLAENTHDFASLDVAFTLNGSDVLLSGLTPKTSAEWATFDPATNFIADPNLKHAYVYTSGSGSVRDAASQDDPDTDGPTILLSHTCTSSATTTTTQRTTTTMSVSPTSTETGTTDTGWETSPTVAGVVLTPELPRTGPSSTARLALGGFNLILVGLISVRLGLEVANR